MGMRFLAVAGFAAIAAACAPIERSRNLNDPAVPAATVAAQVCSDCHGLDGNSVSPNFPRLAGQPEDYLASQLRQFRSHQRSDPAGFVYMWGLSRHLTDAQIDGLARYFAAQSPAPNASGDPALAAKGRAIFEAGVPALKVPPCATCHGAHGEGASTFPRLAGQHADYVRKQLAVFRGSEQRPEAAAMKIVAHDLTNEDIREVAEYVQGLR